MSDPLSGSARPEGGLEPPREALPPPAGGGGFVGEGYGGPGGGGRPRGRDREEPVGQVSLLVRNISHAARPEDLRLLFERFGEVRDIHIPRDFHTK